MLLWVLPGLVWVSLVPNRALERIERLVLSLGFSFVVTPLTTLLLAYIPGPLTQMQLLVAMASVIGLPLVLSILMHWVGRFRVSVRPTPAPEGRLLFSSRQQLPWRKSWVWLVIAVFIAVGLRCANLNYSEFQGDEAKVMVRAARALEGDDAIVFQHKKGPAELTLVMSSWRLTGILNEWTARLPFAWANILGLIAVFLFGRRLGHPHLGGVAACLLAIEGYLVAFGRIVQYQSLVFALSTLGLFCLLVYYVEGHRSLIIVAATLFAGGCLAHYDAILALPAGLLLIGARLRHDRQDIWRTLAFLPIALCIGLVLVGFFYLPFLQSEYVGYTSSYIAHRVGSGFYNNLEVAYVLSAVYDSVYFLVLMLLALAVTTLTTWGKWGRMGQGMACVLFMAAMTAMMWPELWLVEQTTLAWIPFAVLLLGALLAPDQSMGRRAVWVWLGVPSLFYLFFAAVPKTHVHTFFTAWAILAAIGLLKIARWLTIRSRAVRWMTSGLGVAVYAVCGSYAITLFVDHTPEYRRTFPEFKRPIYWTPYEQIPERGLFGFPYRAGWKVVGYLMDMGQLGDSYNSNEEHDITNYYSRQAARGECPPPDVYITAVNVQDEVDIRWDQVQSDYRPAIVVTVGGQPKLVIHKRNATDPAATYCVEDYAGQFDQGTTPDKVAWPAPTVEELATQEFITQEFVIGDFARLIGYRIDTDHALPGGYVDLTLLWEALASPPVNYHVFTHLHDGAMMRGQLDGSPVCGKRPTTSWQPGQIIVDPYRMPVRKDAPVGRVPLTVGMYDLATMERLAVSTSDGLFTDDKIYLTDVVIKGP